jgi:acyl carrier protein
MKTFEDLRAMLLAEMDVPTVDITPDTSVVMDLGFDSLELTSLASMVERKFKLQFSDNELRNFDRLGDIAALVEQRLKERSHS